MTLEDIRKILNCELLTPDVDLGLEIDTVAVSDGMSEILAFHQPGSLMITGLTNIQTVRTASIADIRAIVYIRGKKPNEKTVDLARQKEIPLLATRLGMFDACCLLHEKGMKGTM